MPDEQTGVSSTPTTTETPSTAPVDASTLLESASEADYHKWRVTGEAPTAPTADTADPAPAATDTPADKPADSAPAATPTTKPTRHRTPRTPEDSEKRFQEVLTDRATLRRENDEMRRRLDALERSAPAAPAKDDKQAAPSPAAGTDARPDPKDAAKYPDGQYDPAFMEDLADWKARDVLKREREQFATTRREESQRAAEDRVNREFSTKVEAARKVYPDFDEVALHAPTRIPKDSIIDAWILESPKGADVLYALQTTDGEVERILGLPAHAQVRALVQLEATLEAPDVKTVSDAPAPGRTLGDRASAPGDAVASALKANDFEAYQREMNGRELAAKRDPATGRFR